MSWVAVAIGGSALLGYMGSQNAASAQTGAANQANATQMAQYNQSRQDQMPWMNRGNAAGNQMAYLLGLPGYEYGNDSMGSAMNGGSVNGGPVSGGPRTRDFVNRPRGMVNQMSMDDPTPYYGQGGGQGPVGGGAGQFQGYGDTQGSINPALGGYGSLSTPFSQTNWQADPGYAFRLAEGQKALERSGSARGMTLSGAQAKALDAYGQGMASQEYGNAYNRYTTDQTNLYNRLAGVAGTGQTATQQVGSLGANMANQVSNNQIGAGNANAAAWTAGTGALSNGLNSWMNYNNWNTMQNYQGNNGYGAWGSGPGDSQTGPFGTGGAWASTLPNR